MENLHFWIRIDLAVRTDIALPGLARSWCSVGLVTVGLVTVELGSVGLGTSELCSVGLSTVGLGSVGLGSVGGGTVGLGSLQQLSWDTVAIMLAHSRQASTGTDWSPVVVRGTGPSLVSIHSNLDTQS